MDRLAVYQVCLVGFKVLHAIKIGTFKLLACVLYHLADWAIYPGDINGGTAGVAPGADGKRHVRGCFFEGCPEQFGRLGTTKGDG